MPVTTLFRLMSMRPAEIASRLRQATCKKIDSLGLLAPSGKALDPGTLQRSGQFFFNSSDISDRLELLRNNIPDYDKTILDQAERILRNEIPLLGYGFVRAGTEIDWQLDMVHQVRTALRPWPGIDYLDFSVVGDSKVTCELSRHQFLVTLAKAWLLTADTRYVQKITEIFYDWQNRNPYPLGVNWGSSLEVAFRSLSWIWVDALLATCPTAGPLRQDVARALAFNGWYIRRYLSEYYSPNTHLLGEAAALFFIGTLYPSLPGAPNWRTTGWALIQEHAQTKVLADGAYYEQSTHYHVYALDFFLHARILASRNNIAVSPEYDAILKRMLRYLSFLCQAGPPPRYGDDDGGRVFDGQRNQSEHLSDPLSVGTALYGDSLYKQPGMHLTEEMLWLLGESGVNSFTGCTSCEEGASTVFPVNGLYMLHAGGHSHSQMVFDAGPLGGGSGGHGHADALSLTLNLEGSPLLIDPGTCSYIGSEPDRNNFRSTGFHNTITVDGLSQAQPRSAFSWLRWPETRVEETVFAPGFQFVQASHDGFARSHDPVVHRRTVFSPAAGTWFVLDQIESDAPHTLRVNWHLHPGCTTKLLSENGRAIEVARDRKCLYLLTESEGWHCEFVSGWFSPAYGVRQASPVIQYTKQAQAGDAIASIFLARQPGRDLPALTVAGGQSSALAYQLSADGKHSLFMLRSAGPIMQCEGWETDAKFMHAVYRADHTPASAVLIHASYVRFKGQILQMAATAQPHLVWSRDLHG